MPQADASDSRVAPNFSDLESPIHDLFDMANLVTTAAERWIEGGVLPNKCDVHIPEDERNMLMFGMRRLYVMASELREDYYKAVNHAA